MKRLLFLFAACALPSFAAITLVAHTNTAGTSTIYTATSSAIDTTGATACVVNVETFNGAGVTNNLSDSKNNTWAILNPQDQGIPGQQAEMLYYAIHPTVGAGHTFTITTGRAGGFQVACFSGVTGVKPFDKASPYVTATAASIQPGALTATNASSLCATGVAVDQGSGTIAIDSSFSITDQFQQASTIGGALAYKVCTSAENPTWSWTGSKATNTIMLVLIPGSATPPTTVSLVAHTGVAGAGPSGAINTTGANLCVANLHSSTTTTTFADSKSNTWIAARPYINPSLTVANNMYFVFNPTVGSGHTFTATGTSVGFEVACFSGVPILSLQGQNGIGSNTNTANPQPTGFFPFGSYAGTYFAVAGITSDNQDSFQGIDTGYIFTDFERVGGDIGGALAYYQQTGAGSTILAPTWGFPFTRPFAGTNLVFGPTGAHHGVGAQ